MAANPGRPYTSSVAAVAITAAQDLDEIQPADDTPVQIVGGSLINSTDWGDAQAEILRIAIRRADTASGSGGSSPTLRANQVHDAAGAATVEANNTTKANTSGIRIVSAGVNVADPSPMWFPDLFGPSATQANTTTCRELVAAPADSITFDQSLYFLEF